jgi:hypothetical protein
MGHPSRQSSFDPGVMRLLVRGLLLMLVCVGGLAAVLYYVRRAQAETWDFGRIYEPPGARDMLSTVHQWSDRGDSYRVEYGCSTELKEGFQARYAAVVEAWMRKKVEEHGTRPGPVVIPYNSSVPRWVLGQSFPYMDRLGRRIVEVAGQEEWSADEAVEVVIGLVQNIDYRVPDDAPMQLSLPPVVLAQGWGDCDSKTMLAVTLLRYLGIEATLLASDLETHAILAIDLPMPGRNVLIRGRKWVLVETTRVWGVGNLGPHGLLAPDWRPLNLKGLWPEGVAPPGS